MVIRAANGPVGSLSTDATQQGERFPHSTRTKATLGLACMRMQWMDARMYVRLQLRWDRVSSPPPCLEMDLGVLRGLAGCAGCVALRRVAKREVLVQVNAFIGLTTDPYAPREWKATSRKAWTQ